MKLTKSKLKQIIKEELGLDENVPSDRLSASLREFELAVADVVEEVYEAGMKSDGVVQEMQNKISELFADFASEQADYEGGFKS